MENEKKTVRTIRAAQRGLQNWFASTESTRTTGLDRCSSRGGNFLMRTATASFRIASSWRPWRTQPLQRTLFGSTLARHGLPGTPFAGCGCVGTRGFAVSCFVRCSRSRTFLATTDIDRFNRSSAAGGVILGSARDHFYSSQARRRFERRQEVTHVR